MPSTHAAATDADRDPWGFGTTASDETIAVAVADLAHDDAFDPTDDADAAVLDLMSRLTQSSAAPRTASAPWRLPATAAAPAPASVPTLVAATSTLEAAPAPSALAAAPPTPASRFSAPPAFSSPSLPADIHDHPIERNMAGVLGLLALVILGQAFYIGFSLTGEVRASAAPTGELALSTHPAGARVLIDGQDRGATPVVLALPVGRHRVQVTGDEGAGQTLDADVAVGHRWTRHIVLATSAAAGTGPAATSGAVRIDSGAPGASVWLDGVPSGRTPLTVSGVAAGAHAVRVQFASGASSERRVVLAAGETLSLMLDAPAMKSATPVGPASGWVTVQTPFEVQVIEAGHVVGTSASERIMVTAGGHVFDLVNAALGYTSTVKVVVMAGRTEPLLVETPRTAVQVNAQPWAEVLVDGRLLGETPLANLMLPIGTHQFVFRHPEFGERAQSVTVRLDAANRVTADLRR